MCDYGVFGSAGVVCDETVAQWAARAPEEARRRRERRLSIARIIIAEMSSNPDTWAQAGYTVVRLQEIAALHGYQADEVCAVYWEVIRAARRS
jgi:hypothetical protein